MKRKVILIFGKTGTGKTYLSKQIIAQYNRVIVFDILREYTNCLVVKSLDEFIEFFSDCPETFFVACRFQEEADYEYAASACLLIKNLLVVLEESSLYLTSSRETDCYTQLILHGRHYGISLLGISQRPRGVSVNFRDMSTTRIAFSQDGPETVAYLREWGFNEQELTTLPQYGKIVLGEPLDFLHQA